MPRQAPAGTVGAMSARDRSQAEHRVVLVAEPAEGDVLIEAARARVLFTVRGGGYRLETTPLTER